MRGGKSLADRGMIPRMLSNIYRKSKALEKNSDGDTTVDVSMSYYEIYNDKVFDLFEPPEKRTPTGLPIREAEGGKTVVVGLTELPCSSLKEFEVLYDRANSNRSVGATKLNAHSSRSHAILCVKVTINTPTESRSSTISAIDLAGSEDNRRTGNVKDRMVESASINKSLFVLAQCVEAISKKQSRIPYRESKMTRILSLGQNNGLTVMILNLAPTKAFHLDTLSSLNFANRTKKIEVREVENEPVFKGPPRQTLPSNSNGEMKRQPLRPLNTASNANILANRNVDNKPDKEKPAKAFSVYSDKHKLVKPTKTSPLKRMAQDSISTRPIKQTRPTPPSNTFLRRGPPSTQTITKATLESLVESKVRELLAAREASAVTNQPPPVQTELAPEISAAVQSRLDALEARLTAHAQSAEVDPERAEGLSYLFMAKQATARGDDREALRMYEAARGWFGGNEKLEKKIAKLHAKLQIHDEAVAGHGDEFVNVQGQQDHLEVRRLTKTKTVKARRRRVSEGEDESYHAPARVDEDTSYYDHENNDADSDYHSDVSSHLHARKQGSKKRQPKHKYICSDDAVQEATEPTPRTTKLLQILNARNTYELRRLNGLGAKKADAIVEALDERFDENADEAAISECQLRSWRDVLGLEIKGVGKRGWEVVREGLVV